VFRILKGNAWVETVNVVDIPDMNKSVFVIVFPGANQYMKARLNKVAEAFNATFHEFPESHQVYEFKLKELVE
jgi:V-type ATPase 116kDa subunit family